jgi:hypothetical protein
VIFFFNKKKSLETTGGYVSFLNGKIERHHRTIAQMVRSMLLNSGLPHNLWCYAAEAAADIHRWTFHSALQMTPYEAWYGTKPHINHLRVWGCYVYVRIPDPKKLDNRVTRGHFLGFTKSRLIVRWYDLSTQTVKHASAVRFDECNSRLYPTDNLSPGALLLAGSEPSLPDSTTACIDITDQPHLGTTPFHLSLHLPTTGTGLGCFISTDTYHNLPYISSFTSGTSLSQQLLQHGQHNSSFWILSIDSKEFMTAPAVIQYLNSVQHATATTYISAIFARRIASQRTSLSGHRAVFNQIRLSFTEPSFDDSSPSSIVAPVGLKVISSPT